MSAFPLLSTKLSLPPRRPSLVPRPRLNGLLDLGLQPGSRLTLLSAPAGFGKTSLVIDWAGSLAERGVSLAWLSLDEADNDLARFLRYLAAALQKLQPEVGQTTLAALDLPQHLPVEGLMVPLINDLEYAPGEWALVLDDFQVINDLEVNQAVAYLVDHQPAHFHLLLTTRHDPMLPLARLRARGEVNEIRAADLRFSQEEGLEFIRRVTHLGLDAGQAALLEQRTEGWAAGLQMAAIALQAFAARQGGVPEIDHFLASFGGTHQYVFDYLAQEVLNQQNPEVIDFLHDTSILDRFQSALCDAVVGRSGSEGILKQLDQTHLFILPLDERHQWYRYHYLFAEFLRAGVDTRRRQELCRRAADWFESSGLVEEAVTFALKAQDMPRASRLVREAAPALFGSGEFSTLLAWFDALPENVIRTDPDLCIDLASAALLTNKMDVAVEWTQQVDNNRAGELAEETRGRLLGLKAYLAYARGDHIDIAIRWAEDALALIDPADYFFRLIVLSLLGQIQRQAGSVPAAIHSYEEAIRTSQAQLSQDTRPVNTGLAILQGNLAISYAIHGERRRAIATCQEALRHCTDAKGQVAPQSLFLYMPWAEICFYGNRLADARRYIELGIEQCRRMGTSLTVVGGANILAALNFLDGDREAAFKGIRATQDEALRLGLPWIASHAAAVGAWLEFQSGDLSAVEIWARNNYLPSAMESNPMYTVEQLVYIRLLIARGEYQAALEMLERMRVQAEEGERFQLLSEIEILLALAQDGSGNQAAALESFDRAARRSAPEDGYRIFLNDDTTGLVKKLIASLPKAEDDLLRAFLNQVLVDSGLGAGSTSHSARTASPSGARYHPAPLRAREARGGTGSTKQPAELVEAITPRELDVLQLMAEGLSNAEIARRLYLTVNTLKAHTNSIYGKLDVHSRLQAVNRARALGIISPAPN
jgi:LuxR family maltose regulon positive regulatory protein